MSKSTQQIITFYQVENLLAFAILTVTLKKIADIQRNLIKIPNRVILTIG